MPKITLRLKAYDTSSLKKAFSEISKIFFLISVCVEKFSALSYGFVPSHQPVNTLQKQRMQGIFSDLGEMEFVNMEFVNKVVSSSTKCVSSPSFSGLSSGLSANQKTNQKKQLASTMLHHSAMHTQENKLVNTHFHKAKQKTTFFLKPFSLPSKFSLHSWKQRKKTYSSKVLTLSKNNGTSLPKMSQKVSPPLVYQQMLFGSAVSEAELTNQARSETRHQQSLPIFSKVTNATPPKSLSLQTQNQLYFYDGKVFSYPKTRKVYTIIRSPHIHKKSKEQFEFVCKKKKITIKVKNVSFVSLFFFFLKNCQIPGVEVDFSVEYFTYLKI